MEAMTGVKEVSIHIGGVFASREPAVVRTVLGSCVSACLFDPLVNVGGMNHFMLPDGDTDKDQPTRYGINAMEMLINEIMKRGGERRRLRAKVFGGGHVLNIHSVGMAVPKRNAIFVKEFLATEKIPILSQRLGGVNPLQVHFFTHIGKALIRILGGKNEEIAGEEERYRVEAIKQVTRRRDESVTLF
ncbi:MAG TPA: chemotaxis protein CheD [Candidatus Binatia bacterium]|jgi:chemotaxis receptor (MCP) glutamine deamidase CheD